MKTQVTTLALMAGIALVTLPAFAAENREGMHQMPDGTWMNDHDMPKAAAAKPTQVAATSHIVVATVNGLVCDFCVQSIQKTLMKEPGVTSAKVDLTAKTVTVGLKEGVILDEQRLGKLLTDAGYDMTGYKVE